MTRSRAAPLVSGKGSMPLCICDRIQGCDFTVVGSLELRDKQRQQRRGRMDGAIRSVVVSDAQSEKVRPLLPK